MYIYLVPASIPLILALEIGFAPAHRLLRPRLRCRRRWWGGGILLLLPPLWSEYRYGMDVFGCRDDVFRAVASSLSKKGSVIIDYGETTSKRSLTDNPTRASHAGEI